MALLVPPQAKENTQQTPNDDAHVPDADPPLEVHSVLVKHVPLNPLAAPHASLGNFTTLKTLRILIKRVKRDALLGGETSATMITIPEGVVTKIID